MNDSIDDPLNLSFPPVLPIQIAQQFQIPIWGFINFGEFAELTTKHKLGSPGDDGSFDLGGVPLNSRISLGIYSDIQWYNLLGGLERDFHFSIY